MTRDDVVDLLKVVTAYDRRTVGETDVLVWGEQARRGGWTRLEALEAVHAHYGRTTAMVGPADVHAAIRAARRDRLERAPVSRDPADRELLKQVRALADAKAVDAPRGPVPLPPAQRDRRTRARSISVVAAAMAKGERERARHELDQAAAPESDAS